MTTETTTPQPGDVLVLVGTKKGLFTFWSDESRARWQRAFHHPGWMVHAAALDERDGTLYTAINSEVFGGGVHRSPDLGATWDKTNEGLDFGPDSEYRVHKVWQVAPGAEAGSVLAGTERAGLFASRDRGHHWSGVAGLNAHPHAPDWQPGKGGLCLHTIVQHPTDPDRIWIAISTGGVYRTDDGGTTWTARNKGIAAVFMPDTEPEFGQCVHKLAMNPARPDTLYAQNHWGVYRTVDGGDSWTDIGGDLPSDFGFPVAVHPHDPDTVYVVPIEADTKRYVAGHRMAVWCGLDGGARWEERAAGLPEHAHLVILRDALDVDTCPEHGLYVGTTTGQVFFSRDEGRSWSTLVDYLPPVYSVTVARVPG